MKACNYHFCTNPIFCLFLDSIVCFIKPGVERAELPGLTWRRLDNRVIFYNHIYHKIIKIKMLYKR